MEQYDVLVIGGGPGGYSLGIAAAKKGMKVALFEKEHLGGTCLNVGCIPTKYLVDKANAMEKVRALVKKDIFRDAGSFSFKKIQRGKGEVTAKLVNGVQFLLKKAGAEVIRGEAVLKKDRVVSCNGKDYQGKYVVIATGSVPMMIPIPGHEYCIDSTGALNLSSLPRSMVVMGGGVIGLELACAFAAYGTEITVVEMMPELMPHDQKEAVRILVNDLKKQGIALKTGAKMLRIEKNAPIHTTASGKVLLSSFSYRKVEEIIAEKGLERLTENTITTPEKLFGELALIRKRGYAVDDEECEIGHRCIAVPIYDYSGNVAGAISAFDNIERVTDRRIETVLLPELKRTAREISLRLGYTPDEMP